MKLKNVLIVVKDIEKAKRFYQELFGLTMILDNDGNMILSEGLVLQDEKIWREFIGREIVPENNAGELYFEERDVEAFAERLGIIGRGNLDGNLIVQGIGLSFAYVHNMVLLFRFKGRQR